VSTAPTFGARDNSLLFGADPTPGLLAFAPDPGGTLRVYRRDGVATVVESATFAPFVLLADLALLEGYRGETQTTRLDGEQTFRWLVRLPAWADALRARDHCRERSGPPGSRAASYRFFGDPVQQYLLLSGRTSFVGLSFEHLRRLAIDIEVLSASGLEFPSATRPGDRVIAISFADSSGFRCVLRGDRLDERDLLAECSRLVRERDPDVIEGHNIFRFDLDYLSERARRLGEPLAWGRAGETLRSHPARLQIGERTIDYRRYRVAGRHVIDTWVLAQRHDVAGRDLPSLGLKDIARHFGVSAPERTYIDPEAIPRLFTADPDRLMRYALDDAVETLRLSGVLSPAFFVQAQMVPFDYQSVTLRGNAAKIDALLVREYLRQGRAIPSPGLPGAIGGAYTAIFQQGVARSVRHVDVTSLYPSIMLATDIAPASDTLGAFAGLLRELRQLRVAAKQRMQAADDDGKRAHLNALQQTFKVLINSFYGYLGFSPGHWSDFEAANRVTAEGRRVLIRIIDRLTALGATVIEADTDGVYFVPPAEGGAGERLMAELAADLSPGVQVEVVGQYRAMFSYKMKNYVLLDEGGRLTVRGSALRSRGLEPFQRRIMRELFELLLTGRRDAVPALIARWTADFAAHRVPLRLFMKTDTLHEPLEVYRAERLAGTRPPTAPYEVALRAGRPYRPGDQVSYYVTGRGADVAVAEYSSLALAWDPAAPDENTEYYQAKVEDLWRRFRPFVELEGLRPYIDSPDDREDERQLSLF
jgi:DNA polymerase elongation subunit (family B)